MGDLSKNFSRSEFACKCGCGQDTADYNLIQAAQWVRDIVNSPVSISSGNRCKNWNKKINGSKTSMHLESKAMDFSVDGYRPIEIYHLLDEKYPSKFGLGLYPAWCHIDVRDGCARWNKVEAPPLLILLRK